MYKKKVKIKIFFPKCLFPTFNKYLSKLSDYVVHLIAARYFSLAQNRLLLYNHFFVHRHFNNSPFSLDPINLYLKVPTFANSSPLSDKIICISLFSIRKIIKFAKYTPFLKEHA